MYGDGQSVLFLRFVRIFCNNFSPFLLFQGECLQFKTLKVTLSGWEERPRNSIKPATRWTLSQHIPLNILLEDVAALATD